MQTSDTKMDAIYLNKTRQHALIFHWQRCQTTQIFPYFTDAQFDMHKSLCFLLHMTQQNTTFWGVGTLEWGI